MFDDIIRESVDQYYYQSNYSMLLQLFLNLLCLDIALKITFLLSFTGLSVLVRDKHESLSMLISAYKSKQY